MPTSFNLPLPDELKDFVENQSGDGTSFTSSEEYVRSLIREKMERLEAAKFRQSVLEGYQDILEGRTIEYQGSITEVIDQAKKRNRIN
ncbi:MAG: ribbon-helix-helix domain-containing protein [Pseudomonadales bacterium]